MGEFKQIQEILSKIGTEIFKIDEEMTEKNETEDGNSISLKSPWHMKWDRQQFLPFFPVAEIGSIMHLLYFSYPQEILAQFVEWGKKVLSPYSPQWSVYFSISLLQIAGKHPVFIICYCSRCESGSRMDQRECRRLTTKCTFSQVNGCSSSTDKKKGKKYFMRKTETTEIELR